MAEQKILISIQINDSQAKKTNKALKVTKDNFNSLTDAEKAKIIADKQLTLSSKEVDKALTLQAKAANNAAQATKNGRTQSGLNNAILLETGRLASDASFGFTAIANNLSQVVTLFSSFVKTQGGVIASFKELGRSLMGTGGLLILVQLLISYGADLIKIFASTSAEAVKLKDVFKDAGSQVQETAGRFQTYIATLQDANASQEKQSKALKLLNKEFPDYIKQLDNAGVSIESVKNQTDEATKQNILYEESIRRIARSKAAQSAIEEESAAEIQATLETERILRETYNMTLVEAQEATKVYNEELKNGQTVSAGMAGSVVMTNTAVNRQSENIKVLVDNLKVETDQRKKNIQILEDYVILGDKETEGRGNRNRVFKAADLDFEKETQKSRERLLKGFIKDEKLQIKIKFDGIRERATLKQKEFEDDQQRRLDEFLAVEKDQAKRLDAQRRFDNEIAKSKESLNKYIKQLNAEQLVAIGNLTIEQAQKIIDADRELQFKLQENRQRAADQEILNEGIKAGNLFNLKNEQLEKERERLQFALENENLTFQERMNLQNQLTNVEQQQTNARIEIAELEALSKRQLLDQTANALMAFGDLAGKQTGVGKGLAVAGTLISTYNAAQRAYESQFLPIPTTNSPIRGALAAAAAVASGLANVKNILKVKTPNDKSAGAGGGTTIQAPDFNVVGASQVSQLAETVAGQQAKPVKAFVVGKDISTQQELDRNITNTASFG
jgi:hypothetical protein